MKVLVYPHDLAMGGSQLNAIELAAAVRDRGHEVVIYGQPGVLNGRIDELDLEFVASPDPTVRPSPAVTKSLRALVRHRRFDVLHGYEWPGGLHVALATAGTPATPVCTVMSMSVAPFLPRWLPIIVGTHLMAEREREGGRRDVTVIEPPVDLRQNDPKVDVGTLEAGVRIESGKPLVVAVTRFASELKLEGLLCAIDVVPSMPNRPQLLLVGDGPGREQVAAAAARANARTGRDAVILAGELVDPRPAYAAATVVLGMGGSALRALAFAKPVVVQGERGFWSLLTPESAPTFLRCGWYGVGAGRETGPQQLDAALEQVLEDDALRCRLGQWGRRLVMDRFSLTTAADAQLSQYARAMDKRRGPRSHRLADHSHAAGQYAVHALRRKRDRRRGLGADDFNREPVTPQSRPAPVGSIAPSVDET
jgi:glycosyltransferase involved in cell wall biosynthesis